jgi:hypothetical protein
MSETTAIERVRAYAAQWGVPVRAVRLVRKRRAWWYFRVRWRAFEVDTGDGTADVIVSRDGVSSFEYNPTDPKTFLLPLWAVQPHFTSVTIFWRMAPGEEYKYRWHAWYRTLSDAERAAYKERFPAPTDNERAWSGFYEDVADVPATGANSVAEFIIGRV